MQQYHSVEVNFNSKRYNDFKGLDMNLPAGCSVTAIKEKQNLYV